MIQRNSTYACMKDVERRFTAQTISASICRDSKEMYPDLEYRHIDMRTSKPSGSKGKKTQSRGKQSLCQSSSHQNPPLRPAMSPSLPLAEPPSNSSRAWGSIDSGYSYSQCSRATSQSSMDEYPSPYSYPGEGCSSPMSTNTFTNPPYPALGMSAEMMTAIDQYMRSVLKPEAFAVSPQPLHSNVWSPALEIDPTLTKIETRVSPIKAPVAIVNALLTKSPVRINYPWIHGLPLVIRLRTIQRKWIRLGGTILGLFNTANRMKMN